MFSSAPPVEEILPHRGGMLLIERVLGWDAEHAAVAATPRGDAWYAERGAMPSWIGIELMAQAIAAHVGLVARTRGEPPRRGVLLGTRQFRSSETHFAAGVQLHVMARVSYRDESGLASYDAIIERAGTQIATANVTVYEPPDFEAFLTRSAA
ncbi:MAG: beta-hydroxyacyl-ACP dehydratase [Burkholderiales bacterium]